MTLGEQDVFFFLSFYFAITSFVVRARYPSRMGNTTIEGKMREAIYHALGAERDKLSPKTKEKLAQKLRELALE